MDPFAEKAPQERSANERKAGGSKASLLDALGELQRLWDALDAEPDGLKAEDVARLLLRSRSVAYERLSQLQALLGKDAVVAHQGRHRLMVHGRAPLWLTGPETEALALAQALFTQLPLPHGAAWRRLVQKLERHGALKPELWPQACQRWEGLVWQAPAGEVAPQLLEAWGEAAQNQAAVRWRSPQGQAMEGRVVALRHQGLWQVLLWQAQQGTQAWDLAPLGPPEACVGVPPLPADLSGPREKPQAQSGAEPLAP